MDTLTSMRVFAKVVELQNFADAARRLKLSPAMVTRHIQFLEQRIGVRLLNRTTRQFSLTEAGMLYYERCVNLVTNILEAEGRIAELGSAPRGRLRVTASPNFGTVVLWPIVDQFITRHSDISVDLVLTNRAVNLVEEEIDVALRISPRSLDASLVMRRIATSKVIACAAPSYVRRAGLPVAPSDLANHACLVVNEGAGNHDWVFRRDGEVHAIVPPARVASNDKRLLCRAAVDGAGIVVLPSFIVGEPLADGRLVLVLPDWSIDDLAISVVFPSRKFMPAKTRLFIDYLADCFAGMAQTDIWLPAAVPASPDREVATRGRYQRRSDIQKAVG